RTAVADIVDHERTSALRRDLEQLSSDAGAQLLRALGVDGHEEELRSANISNLGGPIVVGTAPFPRWLRQGIGCDAKGRHAVFYLDGRTGVKVRPEGA